MSLDQEIMGIVEEFEKRLNKLETLVHELQVKAGLKVNRVRCKRCGEYLQSLTTHDFKQCGCPNMTFCDGGTEYQRIGAVDMSLVSIFNPAIGLFEDYDGKVD